MDCQRCWGPTEVVDSRKVGEGLVIRRRRKCKKCGHKFTTEERAA